MLYMQTWKDSHHAAPFNLHKQLCMILYDTIERWHVQPPVDDIYLFIVDFECLIWPHVCWPNYHHPKWKYGVAIRSTPLKLYHCYFAVGIVIWIFYILPPSLFLIILIILFWFCFRANFPRKAKNSFSDSDKNTVTPLRKKKSLQTNFNYCVTDLVHRRFQSIKNSQLVKILWHSQSSLS